MEKALEQAIQRGVKPRAIAMAIREGIKVALLKHKVYHDDIQIFTAAIMDACASEIEKMEPTEKKNAAE